MNTEIWLSLPRVTDTAVWMEEQEPYKIAYFPAEKRAPYGIWSTHAEFTWKSIHFTAQKEWFGAPRNSHLLVYREMIEANKNCEYRMTNRMIVPDAESDWKLIEIQDREDNSCGMLLKNRNGHRGMLCETSQVLSFSFHVDEKREQVNRQYSLTAFEESPIKLEKYISFHTDDEEDYIETAFRECRSAARTRFDDLKGVGSWDYAGRI